MPNTHNAKKSWKAMIKFAHDEPMTPSDWENLSWITLINRDRLEFGPGNCRWAKDEVERTNNLAFYKKLGVQ